MAKVKAPVTKLNAWHHISYGAGDAGGVVTMVMIGYLARFAQNVLFIDPLVYAAILLVWNIWDAVNDPLSVPSWTLCSPRQRTSPTSSVPGSCAPSPFWLSV